MTISAFDCPVCGERVRQQARTGSYMVPSGPVQLRACDVREANPGDRWSRWWRLVPTIGDLAVRLGRLRAWVE